MLGFLDDDVTSQLNNPFLRRVVVFGCSVYCSHRKQTGTAILTDASLNRPPRFLGKSKVYVCFLFISFAHVFNLIKNANTFIGSHLPFVTCAPESMK